MQQYKRTDSAYSTTTSVSNGSDNVFEDEEDGDDDDTIDEYSESGSDDSEYVFFLNISY